MKAAREWRWRGLAAVAALFFALAPSGCNQIAGIEEGELALCDDGQSMADGSCPDEGSSGGNQTGTTGNTSNGSSGGGDACPPSWTAAGGSCYLLEATHRDWPSARQRCVDLGGDLAAIRSPDELAEISALVDGADAWIGGHDRTYEGTLEWSDGEPWDYEPWTDGFASYNSEKRDCVGLAVAPGALPSFEMRNCSDDLALLCERAP